MVMVVDDKNKDTKKRLWIAINKWNRLSVYGSGDRTTGVEWAEAIVSDLVDELIAYKEEYLKCVPFLAAHGLLSSEDK